MKTTLYAVEFTHDDADASMRRLRSSTAMVLCTDIAKKAARGALELPTESEPYCALLLTDKTPPEVYRWMKMDGAPRLDHFVQVQ